MAPNTVCIFESLVNQKICNRDYYGFYYPETTRKRKEAEKVRMWENSLAADDDESF